MTASRPPEDASGDIMSRRQFLGKIRTGAKLILLGVMSAKLAGCATLGVEKTPTVKETVLGLPPIFSPGRWTIPYSHYDVVDGIEMLISPDGKLAIMRNGQPIGHKIQDGKVILNISDMKGTTLTNCEIKEQGAGGYSGIAIFGSGERAEDNSSRYDSLGQLIRQ